MDIDKVLFPHAQVREIQKDLIKEVDNAIKNKKSLIIHAPTGLGKTSATIPMALAHAIEHNQTVFFLTSRHTQHKIAIDTLKAVKEKHNKDFVVVDLIGKKWMCPVSGVDSLYSSEFAEYCKSQREDGLCEFFNNSRDKSQPSTKAQGCMAELKKIMPCHVEKLKEISKQHRLCPYEIALFLAKKAHVIIADYNYIFNSNIRDSLFVKTGITLEESIIIVDEGHNLPSRVREMLTERLSMFILDRAIKEARKYEYPETASYLEIIKQTLVELSLNSNDDELLVPRQMFISMIDKTIEYEQLLADLEFIADDIREKQKRSYIGSVAKFLDAWIGEDEGFARILSKITSNKGQSITLSYRCLDPGLVSENVMRNAYSVIIMSGTLTPTSMYKDILRFPDDAIEKVFPSPFPVENKLSLIVPETTTKFTKRSPDMYRRIAEIAADITNNVPGNSAIFFPSYYLRDQVNNYFATLSKKTNLLEMRELTNVEKHEVLEKLKSYKNTGAVLLGVSSGSFGEGIDLPGDYLKAVVVVGLPLQKPDLETKELIAYYDTLFKKGWDYGYLFPAFSKCLQSAGRCIRSSTDRGVVVFLDERFTWANYYRCFPREMGLMVTRRYNEKVKEFFGTHNI